MTGYNFASTHKYATQGITNSLLILSVTVNNILLECARIYQANFAPKIYFQDTILPAKIFKTKNTVTERN